MPVSQNTIRTRAYELWEQQGRPIGRDRDHWWQAEQELGAADDEEGLDFDAEGVEDPGIGYSLGTNDEDDVEALRGDNTLEGDVMNDPEPDGSIEPTRRGRTNK